ncbi:NAD-dependent epimerase/dehydratase family protein [Candidatus Parcubacteria bacterium]|nr:MAG: NAD-dependent epimerase/dehydratase family protein [Candidatus Parcubacteria bacterium]
MRTRVLVTGGAGFIGSHVVDALLTNRFLVTVLDDFSTGTMQNLPCESPNLTVIDGSILDREKVKNSLSGCGTIIHLAAIASVQQSVDDPFTTHQVNFDGTLVLLDEARKQGVERFLYASTAAVYGDVLSGSVNEAARPSPLTPYAIDKLAGEYYLTYYANNYGIKYTTCRFFNVYGPRQNPSSPYSGVIGIFMNQAIKRKKVNIFGDGLQTRDFVYVKDVARILVGLIHNDKSFGMAINIGRGEGVSLLQLIAIVEKVLGIQLRVEHKEARQGDIRHSQADIQLLRDISHVLPETTLLQGLQELFAHLSGMRKSSE